MTRKHLICISLTAAFLATACVTEDITECPNEYELRIVFDRNMLYADAFASQVKSVDIKVFDSATGRQVFSHAEAGDALAAEGYRVALPVPPGSYDILCWGSMAEGNSFGYADPAADILEHQNVILRTDGGESRSRLNNLYHGLLRGHRFIDNNDIGNTDRQTATIYLTKDTNRINVLLHNLDGTEMDENGFTFSITSANAEMGYDNSIDARREVTYRPWHVSPITAETGNPATSAKAALSAEFSTGRLTENGDSRLDIRRVSDGERIISVPLEKNLLLYKGEFHASMTDREYLDRQDDYAITFILDRNNNWDKASMIYINNWATPPVQYQEW